MWLYALIPLIAALVGWGTNWVAIKLLFYPVQPWGRPPWLGWQGIIPSKAAKMGAITTDTTLSRLGTITEIFAAFDPDKLASRLIQTIAPRLEQYIDELMYEENPKLWEVLPDAVKAVIYYKVRQDLPDTVHKLLHEIGEQIDDMVDLREMVIYHLTQDPRILNKIFLECGKREFRFIIISGLYFGFVFGLIQMTVWWLYPAWWVLPVFGMLIGYATNWIALRIVFQPLVPRKIGPWTVQGLFLKRQQEVAAIWTDIVTHDLLTVHHLIDNMLHGSKSERTQALIRRYVRQIVDQTVGISKPVVQLTVGVEQYLHLKEAVSEKAMELSMAAFEDPGFNAERVQIIQQVMQERMEVLSPEAFQYLLRPAFQEEEWKLILMGAVLGWLAGLFQLFYVFA